MPRPADDPTILAAIDARNRVGELLTALHATPKPLDGAALVWGTLGAAEVALRRVREAMGREMESHE